MTKDEIYQAWKQAKAQLEKKRGGPHVVLVKLDVALRGVYGAFDRDAHIVSVCCGLPTKEQRLVNRPPVTVCEFPESTLDARVQQLLAHKNNVAVIDSIVERTRAIQPVGMPH